MTVAPMEGFLLQQHSHRRDEPNFRDDERMVARYLATGLLAAARRGAALAPMVAGHARGRGDGAPCRRPWPGAGVARPAGPALEIAGAAAHRGTLPIDRVANPRRSSRQPDLGARRCTAWRLRCHLPLGDRHPVRRARLVANTGLGAAGAQPPGQNARLCLRHGGRAGMPQCRPPRMVGAHPPLTPAGAAPGAVINDNRMTARPPLPTSP